MAGSKLTLFEQTIVPHLNAAYNLARWLTRNEHDAEDIVQEAYLRAFRYFDGFKGGDGKAWLLAVVRNTALSWRRRENEMTKVQFDEEAHSADQPATARQGRLDEQATRGGLRDCIELLPLEYREVLIMRELEEMPYRDIAEATGAPIGTVMSRLSRARQRLQKCVTERVKEGFR